VRNVWVPAVSDNGMCPPHVYKRVWDEHGRLDFKCKYCGKDGGK